MKVLIIGGMGVIGGAITEAALKKDIDVYVLSRRAPFEKWKNMQATFIQGNWKDDSFAEHLVSQFFDVIVDTQIFNKEQMARTVQIVNGRCTQFIYISTDSVYKHPCSNLSEDQDIDINDVKWKYGYDKRIAELYLSDHSSEYSFYWTVIRPTITFGDTRIPVGYASRRNTNTLVDRIINSKPILRFDDPKTMHSLCHTSIFGSAVCELFLNPAASSEAYHISDDKSYTYDEIFGVIEDLVGVKAIYAHFPSKVVKKYSKAVYEEMIYDKDPTFTLDNNKIKKMCHNTEFHKDLYEVLSATIQNLKDHREKEGEDLDYNMISDVILLKNYEQITNVSERSCIEKYINGLDKAYILELRKYDRKSSFRNMARMCKRCLRPLKKLVSKR